MSKSVCIIRSNPVTTDSRVQKEAITLYRNGYDVHILAWDRDCDYDFDDGHILVMDRAMPITRIGCKATYGEGFKNIIPYLKFQMRMRKYLKKRKFDIIHACDFDTALFSIGVAQKHRSKFVFDIFDFLAGEPRNWFQYLIKKLQFKIINKADGTIICTEERRRQINGSKPRKLIVVHNTPIQEQVSTNSIIANKNRNVRVGYVGILQDYRLLKEITEFFIKNKEIEWHVGGFGKYEKFFREISEKNENIIFYGELSYEETLSLEKDCDVLLAIYDPSIENHRFAAPNKFYESLMLGKPVIMVRDTGMSDVIERNNIGVLIDYSEEGFGKGLFELIDKKSDWGRMKSDMQRLYMEEYEWTIMSDRLLELYASL